MWYFVVGVLFILGLAIPEFGQSAPAGVVIPRADVKTDTKARSSNGPELYRFVFPKGSVGKVGYTRDELQSGAADAAVKEIDADIVDQLNSLGQKGYRASVLGVDLYIVMKLDEGGYEYQIFRTVSGDRSIKKGLDTKLAEMNQLGFRLIGKDPTVSSCWYLDPDQPEYGEDCEARDVFLFEKELGAKKSVEQTIIEAQPQLGESSSISLENQINEKLKEGFYPALILSQFQILLERVGEANRVNEAKPEIKVVRSIWGRGTLEKKVNGLAKQGFRIVMVDNGIAIMARSSLKQGPATYVWLDANKKDFEKNLGKLQNHGAVFSAMYGSQTGRLKTLMFEQSKEPEAIRAQYRAQDLEIVQKENQQEHRVHTDLTPASKVELETLATLANEGYKIRAIADKYYRMPDTSTLSHRIVLILELVR